ncbi:type II toxin-antitoxin system RelE/ParE family toxin [Agarilytica rhodophyticola]|uniref:type II toxin-antitoxin system RelE/ParE family toxin n=1 Tax=Agarilytica rhodophyticola TaxID=1737490 RepID=UPI000B348149|nr:type II toxin-antitoxin system RelE/ParE family toxin [Agarilytica rhodophyticola]
MYKLRPLALQDTDNIYLYSVSEFGAVVGEKYYNDIFDAFELLSTRPELGKNHQAAANLKSFPCRSHVIFYRIVAGGIVVSRVLHKSMDVERHI